MARAQLPTWLRDAGLLGLAYAVDLAAWGGDRELRDGRLLPLWVVPVASLVALGTLLVRRRYPVAAFSGQLAYALGAGALVPSYVPFTGLLVALFAVGRRCRTGTAAAALGACAVPFTLHTYNAAALARPGPRQLVESVVSLVLWAVIAAGVWGAARAGYRAQRREERLRRRTAEQAREAVQAERLRLARELHDIVSHAVNGMILQAAGARPAAAAGAPEVVRSLRLIEVAGVQAMTELHRLLRVLRQVGPEPPGPEGHDECPGVDDVEGLVELSRAAGLTVDLRTDDDLRGLDASTGLAVYRIVQESLTNAAKHGSSPGRVRIRLERGEERVVLLVDSTMGDRGAGDRPTARRPRGGPAGSAGHGLQGLAERAALLGGELEAGPVGDVFRVRAELPLTSPAAVGGRP